MEIENPYFQEVLQVLNQFEVQYILVGGLAVAYHGYHRYTGDMDLWIGPGKTNMEKLYKALVEGLHYPPGNVREIRLGRDTDSPTPIRLVSDDDTYYIDLMTNTFQPFLTWHECHRECQYMDLQTFKVPVVHINHLIRMKENTKRLGNSMKDLVDAHELKKILKLREKKDRGDIGGPDISR